MKAFLLCVALLSPAALQAQNAFPISAEVRGAFAIPTGEWADDDGFGNGLGFGGALNYWASPSIGIFGGWDRFSFSVDESDLDPDMDAHTTDSGFRAGLHLRVPIASAPSLLPFVQLGGIYSRTDIGVSGDAGSLSFVSDYELGYEIAAGADFDAGPVGLRPSLFYRSHDAEFQILGIESAGTVSYFGAVISVVLSR